MKEIEQWIKRELEREEETFIELTKRIKVELKSRMNKDVKELKKGWERVRAKSRGG